MIIKLSQSLIQKIESSTIEAQVNVTNKLKLYDFAASAIIFYSKNMKNDLADYDFQDFRKEFKLVNFKKDKEIENITYKEIIKVGEKFTENELSDSIFIFNISIFESWLLNIFRMGLLENPEYVYCDKPKKDQKIHISLVHESEEIGQVLEKVIDQYLRSIPYSGVLKMIELFLKFFNIKPPKITKDIIEKINENSLCRNLIIHNQKKVNEIYVNNCGEFANFKIGETAKVTRDYLFAQGDNLLRFMQDFRKCITS